MPLYRFIYISNGPSGLTIDQLNALAERCVAFRQTDGLTGVLISLDDSFFGLLEGEEDSISSTIERLESSPYHSGMIKLSHRETSELTYTDWSVGTRRRSTLGTSPHIFDAPDDQSVFKRAVIQPDIEFDVFLQSFYKSNTR